MLLMAFGFIIERFGLFLEIVGKEEIKVFQRHISFFVGICCILLASFLTFYSIVQYKRVLKTLKPVAIPTGYNVVLRVMTNGIIGFLGVLLGFYLIRGFL